LCSITARVSSECCAFSRKKRIIKKAKHKKLGLTFSFIRPQRNVQARTHRIGLVFKTVRPCFSNLERQRGCPVGWPEKDQETEREGTSIVEWPWWEFGGAGIYTFSFFSVFLIDVKDIENV